MIPALRKQTRLVDVLEAVFQTATGTRTALFLMDNLRRLPTGMPRSPDLALANLDLEEQNEDWNSNPPVTPTRNRSVTYVLTGPTRTRTRTRKSTSTCTSCGRSISISVALPGRRG